MAVAGRLARPLRAFTLPAATPAFGTSCENGGVSTAMSPSQT